MNTDKNHLPTREDFLKLVTEIFQTPEIIKHYNNDLLLIRLTHFIEDELTGNHLVLQVHLMTAQT